MTRPASDVQACLRGLRSAIRDLGRSRKRLLERLESGQMSDREATAAEIELRRCVAKRAEMQAQLAEHEQHLRDVAVLQQLTDRNRLPEVVPPSIHDPDPLDGGED